MLLIAAVLLQDLVSVTVAFCLSKYSNVNTKKRKLAVVMCQRSPSKVSGLFIKISALFTANFRFVAVLYIPYLVPSIFFDARLVRSNRLVKSNKMQQNVAKTGWELTKVERMGTSRSVYGQKWVAVSYTHLTLPTKA